MLGSPARGLGSPARGLMPTGMAMVRSRISSRDSEARQMVGGAFQGTEAAGPSLPPMPSSMKVLGEDGQVTAVSLGLGAAEGISHFCCLPTPKGGWLGPMGFLRMVSYALAGTALLGILLALLTVLFQDMLGFLTSLLLVLAAGCSAVAAYAHEGLANEVSRMARQNALFASKNEEFRKQTEALGVVAQRVDSLQQSLGMHADDLQKVLDALHASVATQQLATVVRAFTDADGFGTTDRCLQGSEVEEFFDHTRDLLKEAVPGFDLSRLESECKASGIGIVKMRFLVNALAAGSDAQPGRSTAMLALVLFSVDPVQNFEECHDALRVVLRRSSEEEIKALLQAKKEKAKSSPFGRLSCKDLEDVAQRVMRS